jgi:hypothetical protein
MAARISRSLGACQIKTSRENENNGQTMPSAMATRVRNRVNENDVVRDESVG